jgi:hypothetical protein
MENTTTTNFVTAFKAKTNAFVLHAIEFCKGLPLVKEKVLAQQLVPIYSSRIADRIKNKSEFYATMKSEENKVEEDLFWHNVLTDAGLVNSKDSSAEVSDIKGILAVLANAKKLNK